jgi:hypothetical protein
MTSARAIDTTINEESLAGVTISNPPKLCHPERSPSMSLFECQGHEFTDRAFIS